MEQQPRKKIIAGLGASEYGETYYVIENQKSAKTKLGFKALAEHFGVGFNDIIVVGTEPDEDAGLGKGSNWELVAQELGEPLSERQKVVVPFGLNEKEHYAFFAKLIGIDEPVDELIIDMTHGFRTFPVMMLMTLLFRKAIQPDTFKSIRVFYGAYEAAKDVPDEFWYDKARNPRAVKISPMVEMNIIPDLLDWMKAAERFIEFGLLSDLAELAKKEQLGNLHKLMSKVHLDFAYNTIHAIPKSVGSLMAQLKGQSKKVGSEHPLGYLRPSFEGVLQEFTNQDAAEHYLSAAKYFYRIERYGQASVCFREYLTSIVTQLYVDESGKNPLSSEVRKMPDNLLGLIRMDGENLVELWSGRALQVKTWVFDWDAEFQRELVQCLNTLFEIRNTFAHGKQTNKLEQLHKEFNRLISNPERWLLLRQAPVKKWVTDIEPWYK